jgi:hypothetical protein
MQEEMVEEHANTWAKVERGGVCKEMSKARKAGSGQGRRFGQERLEL